MLKTLCHLPHLKLFFLVFPLQKIKREPFLEEGHFIKLYIKQSIKHKNVQTASAAIIIYLPVTVTPWSFIAFCLDLFYSLQETTW